MAVDTEQERRSTLGVLPLADSLIDRFDRRAAWRIYSGSAARDPVATRYSIIGSDTSKPSLYTDVRSYADELDAMLVVSPTGSYKSIFSTESFTDDDSVYNTSCWAADLDFTGCVWYGVDSAGDSISNAKETGTLISPRHALVAYHVTQAVGNKMTWIAADGTSHVRTILDLSPAIGGGTNLEVQIVYYSADLPGTIANYRVLPIDYETHVPEFPEYSTTSTNVSPIIVLDQEHQALVRDWYEVLDFLDGNYYMRDRNASDGNRVSYTETIEFGDSSSPLFVLIRGELVLLAARLDSATGPFVTVYIDAINAAMTTLEDDNDGSDGYQLSEWVPPADVESVLIGAASAHPALVGA